MSIGSIGFSTIPFGAKLFTTDLDGTFLNPVADNSKRSVKDRVFDEESIKRTTSALKENDFDTVLINTGRNFSELQEVEGIFRETELPIKAISLEDGKRLLKKPCDLSPKQWMAQLFNKGGNYLRFIDENWALNNEKPLKLIEDCLVREFGFIHRKNDGEKLIFSKPVDILDIGVEKFVNNPRWEIKIIPPGIDFELKLKNSDDEDDIDIEEFNNEIKSRIKDILVKNNYDITKTETNKEVIYKNTFVRSDINKASVANYLKNSLNEETEEVRAGDGANDIEMLTDENIQAIQVGQNPQLSAALEGRGNVIKTQPGCLDEGIELASKRLNIEA